ncbi:MAG: hypothetical protein KAH57_06560 [Thermoplasmata archaeon]|nr:hypothetical protein [Thermoplasmata archaeon]
MTTRCPRCGKNNYGDVGKCSFCGNEMRILPGDEGESILTEEDVQEKLSQLKGERIRNPYLIAGGGSMMVIGVVLAFIMYAVIMFIVFSPGDVEVSYDSGLWNYSVAGEEYIYGEITKVSDYDDTLWEQDHGYEDNTAYEINGDGSDTRRSAHEEGRVDREPDLWIYSSKDLGEKGDTILIKIEVDQNELGEARAVYVDDPWWGQSGWIFAFTGVLILIAGAILLTIGVVGRTDKSMDRLLEEDAEFRRQQLNMIHAAKIKAQEEAKKSGWGADPYAATPIMPEGAQQAPEQPMGAAPDQIQPQPGEQPPQGDPVVTQQIEGSPEVPPQPTAQQPPAQGVSVQPQPAVPPQQVPQPAPAPEQPVATQPQPAEPTQGQ